MTGTQNGTTEAYMGMKNIYTAIEKWQVTEVSRRRQTKYGVAWLHPEEQHETWKQVIDIEPPRRRKMVW
jgi:hypothetical protein